MVHRIIGWLIMALWLSIPVICLTTDPDSTFGLVVPFVAGVLCAASYHYSMWTPKVRASIGMLPTTYCSNCDRHDIPVTDMAWTEDGLQWLCKTCREPEKVIAPPEPKKVVSERVKPPTPRNKVKPSVRNLDDSRKAMQALAALPERTGSSWDGMQFTLVKHPSDWRCPCGKPATHYEWNTGKRYCEMDAALQPLRPSYSGCATHRQGGCVCKKEGMAPCPPKAVGGPIPGYYSTPNGDGSYTMHAKPVKAEFHNEEGWHEKYDCDCDRVQAFGGQTVRTMHNRKCQAAQDEFNRAVNAGKPAQINRNKDGSYTVMVREPGKWPVATTYGRTGSS